MTILRYHGFSNWQVMKKAREDLDENFTFGFELEVTKDSSSDIVCSPDELATKIKDEYGDLFVCEHDGSIAYGVEIISQPMTWQWFLENQTKFQNLLKLCIDFGFDSHNGNLCGLHVHVGRKALNGKRNGKKLLVDRVITNINYICERYQEELFKFSRRTTSSFNRWCQNYTELVELENGNQFIDKSSIRQIGTHHINRYHVLNLNNHKTIEFRFIRGTLKWETFYLSLNLIKNIVEESRISDNNITFLNLVYKGLDGEWQEKAKEYLEQRRIDTSTSQILKLERTYIKTDNTSINLEALIHDFELN